MTDEPCLHCALARVVVDHYGGATAIVTAEALAHLIAVQADLIVAAPCHEASVQLLTDIVECLRDELRALARGEVTAAPAPSH